MNNNVNLNTFPSDTCQALAFLYTQNQDLKGKTPNEIAEIYISAYEEINSNIRGIAQSVKSRKANNISLS